MTPPKPRKEQGKAIDRYFEKHDSSLPTRLDSKKALEESRYWTCPKCDWAYHSPDLNGPMGHALKTGHIPEPTQKAVDRWGPIMGSNSVIEPFKPREENRTDEYLGRD